ncbi:MAG: Fic family protein [Verrucomicrobia bacterium]|nr:Fic family protein [Verrucomicrobiota bacterium]MDA1068070.1 Fic family protein [Verrucomicrobiota bacterium]
MTWNWQREDWPNFSYDAVALTELENRFLRESGTLLGAFKHLGSNERKTITIDLISDEALKTSEIEGEFLDRESLQSSIRKQFGLQADGKKIPPAEQGVAEMMVDLYENFDTTLDHTTLHDWHRMLLNARKDIKEIGRYRSNPEPMQVVSGTIHAPKVHFEAPPSAYVTWEMDVFVKWYQQSKDAIPVLTRAGIAHAYFVSIHPFEDGNGRIGRAISEKAMSEKLGQPTLIALAKTIEGNKKAYYEALQGINRTNEITSWLIYFANTVLEAQKATINLVEFAIAKAKLYDRLSDQLNARQAKVIARLFKEGPSGFTGGLSAENYISITRTSRATATRDLSDLVNKGALTKTGMLKHTRYYLNI